MANVLTDTVQWVTGTIGAAVQAPLNFLTPRSDTDDPNPPPPLPQQQPPSDLELFQEAADAYDDWLPATPLTENERLYMHALRMQATRGNVEGTRPPLTRPRERAKWSAWAQLEGDLTKAQAKAKFAAEVKHMMQRHGKRDPSEASSSGLGRMVSGALGRLPRRGTGSSG